MSPLSVAFVAAAAICCTAGLQQIVMALRVEDRKLHVLFAVAAFAVAADAVFELRVMASATAEQYLAGMPWTGLTSATAVVALSWYMAFRTGAARRWLLWVLSALALVMVVLDFAVGITYTGPVELGVSTLPWGEQITRVSGAANPLRILGDLVVYGFLIFLFDLTIRMARRGDRRQARFLGGSLAVFALSLLTILPADLGWFLLPSPRTFAFLFIVAAMGWELSGYFIRAARLSREVVANERRWRQLIGDVQLLAVRTDRLGRIVDVNPHFIRITGHTADNVAGREYWAFVVPEQREERRAAFARAMEGNPTDEVEVVTITGEGQRRHITWRNVLLRDADGMIEGMLSIGADVTEQRDAEQQRDRALVELEATVSELEMVKTKLEEENVYLKEEINSRSGHGQIIGESEALHYVLHKIGQVAATDATTLIQGETGVGKELVAAAIHQESNRSRGPFLAVNCAALPVSLIESALFGHEKGAFTDADRLRKGMFELAHGGTLFLDEIAELPVETQPKLLRVLQDGLVVRVGGSTTIEVDVRLIAATNRDLRGEVEAGRFREDLFYRLDVYPITVPPLRDRRGDIALLVRHFSGELAARHRVSVKEVPQEVMRQLEAYDWPGNVRELQNVIERAVLTASDGVLRLAAPLEGRSGGSQPLQARENGRLLTLEEVERSHIEAILEACGGQIAGSGGAAEILGLHPNTLRSRLKKLGIEITR